MKRKLLEQVFSQQPPGLLWHYTDQVGMLGIIRARQLWATHTQYLNDTREFSHAVEMVRQELSASLAASPTAVALESPAHQDEGTIEPVTETQKRCTALREMQGVIGNGERLADINVCVVSFSELSDSLSQWRAYAPTGGFCLGFRAPRLALLGSPHGFNLARCVYDRGGQQALVQALIEELIDENAEHNEQGHEGSRLPYGGNLLPYLYRYAPILKDPSFAEEREWRLISFPKLCTGASFDFRPGRSAVVPFYRLPLDDSKGAFPLEEIVIGPTPDPHRSEMSAKSFLFSQRLDQVKVTRSTVPYRNW